MNLVKEYKEIDNKLTDLLYKSNSLADISTPEGKAWEEYKQLEQERREKTRALFVGNKQDQKADYIHDAILCHDDEEMIDALLPIGYHVTIIASYYNTTMRCYDTIAQVYKSKNNHYFIHVATYNKVEEGRVFVKMEKITN